MLKSVYNDFSDSFEARKKYRLDIDDLPKTRALNVANESIDEIIDFRSDKMLDIIQKQIDHHKKQQVPRLEKLKKYFLSENEILNRKNKPDGYSDNRLSSGFAEFIVSFKQGVLLGHPVEYKGDESICTKIDKFKSSNNEDYHNQLMSRDMFTFGRAYEYVGRDENLNEIVRKLDVKETFVVYDNSLEERSLYAVRHYTQTTNDEDTTKVEVYSSDGLLYKFSKELDELKFSEVSNTYFDGVQINEWINNEDRTGDFERVISYIDAYDLSLSEMANFQEDSSNAYLVLENVNLPKNEETQKKDVEKFKRDMRNSNVIILEQDGKYGEDSSFPPKAYYVSRQYDVAGVEAHNKRLVADILRFTSLIDFTDENIGSNQSGVGFRFKGWGNDNDRKNKEQMVSKALMRRLRIVADSWMLKDKLFGKNHENIYDLINELEIKFTPNVPQSDEEIMKVITGLATQLSEKTIYEMSERLTGVPSDEELKRVEEEKTEGYAKSMELLVGSNEIANIGE